MVEYITTQAALNAIDDERAKWQALVAEVGPDRMEIAGVSGDWTFKDVAAHLSFWMEGILHTAEQVANGTREPFKKPWPDGLSEPDGINEWAYKQSKSRSVGDVLAEADGVYERLHRSVERIPQSALNADDLYEWQNGEPFAQWIVDRRLFGHYYEEHEAAIREWLEQTG